MDESLTQGTENDCYILGGLSLAEHSLVSLTNQLVSLKESLNLPPHFEIKWNTGSLQNQLKENNLPTNNDFLKQIKQRTVEILTNDDLSSSYYLYITLKEFYRDHGWETIQWGLNTILDRFHKHDLKSREESGIVFIDEWSDDVTQGVGTEESDNISRVELREETFIYVSQVYGKGIKRLNRKVKCSHNSQSPLLMIVPNIDSRMSPGHQANDVILGLFQHFTRCSLMHTGMNKQIITILDDLFELMPKRNYPVPRPVINESIFFRPLKRSNSATYFLNDLEDAYKLQFNIS